jgi:DNA sulfur modification protein DndB
LPDWQQARERKVSPAELRRDYVHAHTLALAALGRVGCDLLDRHPRD